MKKLKNVMLFICTFILVILISDKVYAASTTLTASSYSVTTGNNVNITVGVQATEAWRLNLTASGGTLGGTTSVADVADGEVTKNVMSATFLASTPGTYTITLSGEVTGSDLVKQNVNKSITITVSAPVQQPSPSPSAPPANPSPAAPTFSSVNETVYVYNTDSVNVRSSYSTSSSIIGSLKKGDSVTRTGISTNLVDGYTWSRVTYNGKTGYIVSRYLTTTKPAEEPSPTPSTKPEEEKSNDSTLKSLTITGVQLTPAFASNITSYIANIGEEITEVEVLAEVNNEKAKYEIVGNKDLQDGENTIIVTVTAEDGTVTNYEIKLTKGTPEIPLNAFVIMGIKYNGEKVEIKLGEPIISENIVEYTINLEEWLKSIEILNALNNDNIVYEGIGTFDLVVGENKYTVILKIPQEGAEERTIEYRITINNPEKVVEVAKEENNKVNYKLIVIIAIIILVAILVITLLIVHYKKQNNLEYAKPDYSFLGEDEEIQNKEKQREENNKNNEPKKRGGKHF